MLLSLKWKQKEEIAFPFFLGGGGPGGGGAGGFNEDLLGAFWRDLVLAHFFDRGFINAQM